MAGATGQFGIAYPTRMDVLEAQVFSDAANKVDGILSEMCGTGQLVQMRKEQGSYQLQTSNHFLTGYDASLTIERVYANAGTNILTPYESSGLVRVPAGWAVMVFGYITLTATQNLGATSVAAGFGAAATSTATTPTTDLGSTLFPTVTGTPNLGATIPPILYVNDKSYNMYVGMYARCAAQPPASYYNFGCVVLSRGTSLI